MRRHIAGLAVLALAALAACAPGSDDADESAPGQVDDKSLTYIYFTDGPDEQATRNLIADFEKSTGAKVNLQIVPFANLEQQLQARLSGDNAPDVARVTDIAPYRADLLDLNKYEKANLDGKFVEGADPTVKGANGELLAVPSDLTMNGPLINVDQFRKANVALPDPAKPWTWTEMVAAAQAVQKANGTENAIAMDVSGHRFATMLSQFGTTYLGADGKVLLDKAKAVAAVTRFASLNASNAMPKDLWLQAGSKYKAANEIFLAQQVPVYLSGNWQVSAFEKSAKFTWQAAPNPCQERCGGFPGGKFMVSFTKSKRQKLAARFIAFMNTSDAQKRMAQEAAFLPTRRDLIEAGVAYPRRGEDMSLFLNEVRKTAPETFANNYNPAFGAISRATVAALGKVIAGQSSAEAAVEEIRAAADKAVGTK